MLLDFGDCKSLQDAAMRYAEAGFSVFPCQPGGKAPIHGWHWLSANSNSVPTVRQWWEQYPEANIGLVCGPISACLVLDLDQREDRDGARSYLDAGGERNPTCPVSSTPSGGAHLWYSHQTGLSNVTRRGSGAGLDLRTQGGYVVVPPSVTAHGQYTWINPLRSPLPPPPPVLLETLRSWSTSRDARPLEGMPEVVPLDDHQVEQALATAGPWADYLRGEDDRPDDSSALYGCAMGLAKLGWTGAQILSVWEHTYPAEVARRHTGGVGGRTAQWLWQYTVAPALRVTETERAAIRQHLEAVPVETWRDLLSRADVILTEDVPDFLGEVASAEIEDLHLEQILRAVQARTKLTKAALIKEVTRLRRVARDATVEAAETERAVYCQDQDKMILTHSGRLVAVQAWLIERTRRYGGSPDDLRERLLYGKQALCPIVETQTYDPGRPPGVVEIAGVRTYNRYRPGRLQPRAGDVSPWLALLKALRLAGGEEEEEYLLDWMAHVVQRPGEKCNQAILFGGAPGIGKDSLLQPLILSVGTHNVRQPGGNELVKGFSDYLTDAQLLIVQELRLGQHRDSQSVYEQLKPVCAAPPHVLRIDAKQLRPWEQPNLISVIGLTNHRNPLHLDPEDRRWTCLWCDQVIQTRDPAWVAWFRRYWDWLGRGGAAAVYDLLLRRDLSAWEPAAAAPLTAWRAEITEASAFGLDAWLREELAYGRWKDRSAVLHHEIDSAMLLARQFGKIGNSAMIQGAVGRAMAALGWTRLRRRHERERYVYWVPRQKAREWKEVSQEVWLAEVGLEGDRMNLDDKVVPIR